LITNVILAFQNRTFGTTRQPNLLLDVGFGFIDQAKTIHDNPLQTNIST